MEPGPAALLLLLLLSPLRACGAERPEPGQPRGGQWVWAASSRGKRDASGREPGATAMIGSDKADGGAVPAAAPGSKASLPRGPSTAHPLDDSPEPELLLSSAAAAPGTNASLLRGSPEPTTAEAMADSPHPDVLQGSVSPPAPSARTSQLRVPAASPTAEPRDETDPPEPDLLLSSASTKPSRALAVPTTAEPTDETDPPDPELLPGSPPAPQKSITTTPSWLTVPTEQGGPGSSSSRAPTTTGHKKIQNGGAVPTRPAPRATTPRGAAVPWEPSGLMGKCLLAMLLLGLVAATFLVCTGVLGALLWRRARTGHRRLSRTEMVCISSLLPDAEAAAGPRPVPARRNKLLLADGSSEPDGDNLTLSSFLPEHS